ncbi:Hypothetical protein FKW44_001338 [Caligus rogercresseyi]|uniref:Uncharacterized protein n=1 Tax=Caligus rogercresseyi TaxID=217165 RepID=A0A7T8KIL7_CALRO|nr:Hypothetical protein FKW44_001338 [Caligus rogercresseyi]
MKVLAIFCLLLASTSGRRVPRQDSYGIPGGEVISDESLAIDGGESQDTGCNTVVEQVCRDTSEEKCAPVNDNSADK